MRSKVALVRCDTYDNAAVGKAVERGFQLIGGISRFVRTGESILMKPNVLYGTSPQKGVTTHPAVLRAVGTLLKKAGATVSYGDSASFGSCEWQMQRAGLKQVGDELNIKLADCDKGRTVSHPGALLIKSFVIANGVLASDGVVNLPKLKTHALLRLTGAVKNLFGCVPGLLKGQYHVKLPDPYDFATMLVDLNTLIKPRLCIMDGITAMEGNGPRNGKPKRMNVLLFSDDPVALDATACRIIGLDPESVPTSGPGEKAGLGTYHMENIDIAGDELELFMDNSFEVVRTAPDRCATGRMRALIRNRVCEKPVIDRAKCTRCGICVEMCPVQPKAVDWPGGDKSHPPEYRYDRCIRCYCCQENCPEGAVSVEQPLLSGLVSRL